MNPVDFSPVWKCTNCGYTYQAPQPSAECPSCHKKCLAVDVTCYAPDCAGQGRDPRLG